ncbi:MAG: FAD-dependent oxidoreductase [Bdellovibrionales bacterium]|nr:FAD-dependent oxidoreductase [Bdellovibrionales bacterium]
MTKKVVVVGGGFSGLVTAYYLSRRGMDVELHEASSRLGGLLGSERLESGLVETAANGFILNDALVELLEDIGLEYIRPLKGARKRFIFRDGFKRWPLNIFETFGLISKALPRFFFRRPSFRPQTDETVWTWGLRCLNRAATRYLLSPALQGIYAGDVHRMSAELILGPMFGGQKQKYRGTVSFKKGMGEFVAAIEKKLVHQGVKIHLNSFYQIENFAVPHVVCVSAAATAKVLEKAAPAVGAMLSQIEVLPVLSATVFFEKPRFKIQGFGVLFPDDQQYRVLGILSPTHIFENRGPEYSETWIFGGAHSPEVLEKSNEQILELIQSERTRIFGLTDKVREYRMHPWPKALPHYTLEHKKLLSELQLPKNLYLNGNYMGVIGLSKILIRSKELAQKVINGIN